MATWNARGLLCYDLTNRRRKLAFVGQLLRQARIVMIQELHGDKDMFQVAARPFRHKFYSYASPGIDKATGGIAVFIVKSLFEGGGGRANLCS